VSLEVEHVPERGRFQATVEGHTCVLEYRRAGSTAFMEHVGVPGPVEGRGIASALTRAAVEWARSEGLEIVALCPYVAAWMRRHPDA
jgi:hypothetical protein